MLNIHGREERQTVWFLAQTQPQKQHHKVRAQRRQKNEHAGMWTRTKRRQRRGSEKKDYIKQMKWLLITAGS